LGTRKSQEIQSKTLRQRKISMNEQTGASRRDFMKGTGVALTAGGLGGGEDSGGGPWGGGKGPNTPGGGAGSGARAGADRAGWWVGRKGAGEGGGKGRCVGRSIEHEPQGAARPV